MNIGSLKRLFDVIPTEADETEVAIGFDSPHSWRGIYDEAAVEPAINVTIGEMRNVIQELLTEEFHGYKGGGYRYNEATPLHLSRWGNADSLDFGSALVSLIEAWSDWHLLATYSKKESN